VTHGSPYAASAALPLERHRGHQADYASQLTRRIHPRSLTGTVVAQASASALPCCTHRAQRSSKGGAAGIRHEDFRDTHGDAVAHELIQGVHEFLPKADVRPHDEIERGELQGHEVRKGALPGGDGHPVALGMQLELGKHRRIGVQPSDLRLEHFGAGDADQPPAAAEFQHAGLRGHTALLEIV